jgi:hypothetical protein
VVGGSVIVEGLVGSVVVVGVYPGIEGGLDGGELVPGSSAEDVFSEGAVEAFVFASGLGMKRAAMDHVDVE